MRVISQNYEMWRDLIQIGFDSDFQVYEWIKSEIPPSTIRRYLIEISHVVKMSSLFLENTLRKYV